MSEEEEVAAPLPTQPVSYADLDAALASITAQLGGLNEVDRGPLYGFEKSDRVRELEEDLGISFSEASDELFTERQRITGYTSPGAVDRASDRIRVLDEMVSSGASIYQEDIAASIRSMFAAGTEKHLAMEMLINVPGAYASAEDLFTEDGEIHPFYFSKALSVTMDYAEQYGPEGFGREGSVFLDVLMNNTDSSPEELDALFQERMAEIEAEKSKGGGRVINYIDPVALKNAAKDQFSQDLGRTATPAEQKAMIKMIHSLQAQGMTGIDVAGRMSDAARAGSPVEAAAMDHVGAARLVMQAIGGGPQ